VDEKALVRALTEGRIGAAGLDVFAQEPIEKDDPLLGLGNVVLTPHNAVMNQDAITRLAVMNGVQVERALNEVYENVVNPEVLEKAER